MVVLLLVQCQTCRTAVHWIWFWNLLKISTICHLASAAWDHFKRQDYVPSSIVNKWTYRFSLCIKIQIRAVDISVYFRIYGEKGLSFGWRAGIGARKSHFLLQLSFSNCGQIVPSCLERRKMTKIVLLVWTSKSWCTYLSAPLVAFLLSLAVMN